MKKFLLTFIIALTAFMANAQIQDTFFGCKMNQTTKSQVYSTLTGRNYKPMTVDNGYYLENVDFAGVNWSIIAFLFYDNKLYQVLFIDDSSKVTKVYDTISSSLRKKYSKYITKDEYHSFVALDDYNSVTIYVDKTDDGKDEVALGYTNLFLLDKKDKDEAANDL